MSRAIPAHMVTMRVTEAVVKLGGRLNAEDIRTLMHDITADLVRVAEISIEAVALQVVEEDYRSTLEGQPFPSTFLPSGSLHTLKNINRVKERTGCDLNEAKNAVTVAVAKVYRNIADNALTHLAMANAKVPTYAERAYVNAVDHRYVMQNMNAAVNEPPF